jgi:general secretion pathway protein C
MQTPAPSIWWLRSTTFTLAALTAASASYWLLQWPAATPPGPSGAALPASTAAPDTQLVARLLGGGPAGALADETLDPPASHFKLSGVVADRQQGGYALIAVDEQPAKPYRVGAPVTETLMLHSVTRRSAALAARLDAPVSVTLELPEN